MKLSDGEKLILVMLCDLHRKLGVKGDINPKFVLSAIDSGNLWGLEDHYQGILQAEEKERDTVREVGDILDMWWQMEVVYKKFTEAEKSKIAADVGPLGKEVTFRGFDGNGEGEHFSIARFLIDDLGRFQHFRGRDLNAGMSTLNAYRRMLAVFRPLRAGLLGGAVLGPAEMIELLRARIYPA